MTIITNGFLVNQGVALGMPVSGENDFINNASAFNNYFNPYTTNGRCTGKGGAMNFIGGVICDALDINIHDNATCSSISGCEWHNATIILGVKVYDDRCEGYVNLTSVNITSELDYSNKYCRASGLQSQSACEMFRCTWYNATDYASYDIDTKFSTVTIFDTIFWIFTFRYDFGFESFFNILVNFFLAVILPIIIAVMVYYIIIPATS